MLGNGRYILNIKGVSYPLYFNVPACEEFTKRVNGHKTDNSFRSVTDLIFCGLVGHASASNIPEPEYGHAYSIASDLYMQPDKDDTIRAIANVFTKSKATTDEEENGGEERKGKEDLSKYWDSVRKYCLGFIGMTETEYNNITYANLMRKVNGFNDRVKVNISMKRHLSWVTYISPHLDPKKMAKTIDEFWPQAGSGGGQKKIDAEKRQRIQVYLQQRNERNNDKNQG